MVFSAVIRDKLLEILVKINLNIYFKHFLVLSYGRSAILIFFANYSSLEKKLRFFHEVGEIFIFLLFYL